MRLYLEDLKRNKYFCKELNKYIKAKDKLDAQHPRKEDIIDFLIDEYIKLGKITRKALKKYKDGKDIEIIKKLSQKYSLDGELFSYITFPILTKNLLSESPNAEIDVCCLVDNYDKNFDKHEAHPEFPLILDPLQQIHFRAYPVSIDINRLATKRDILDYIEKKWPDIKAGLSNYREKDVRIRKRKYDQKILDFIWENKNLKLSELKKNLDKHFHNDLVYYEIQKIISLEKVRRREKINVGQ
jgi:hypothetical protein